MADFGRPTKYEPEMCEKLKALMKEGASKTEVCAELGITRDTFYRWTDEEGDYYNPDFSYAVKEGHALAQAWWEQQARKGIWAGKDFNATTFIFMMKNRFREDYNVKDGQQDIHINTGPKGLVVEGMNEEKI